MRIAALIFGISMVAASARAAAPPVTPAPGAAGGRPVLFALILGVNHGVDPELPVLRYADDDAARYGDLFRAAGARTVLLTRADENTRRISPETVAARTPRRAELDAAVATLAADVIAARRSGMRPILYFIYAGHGNIAGTEAYLALEDARLTGRDLERDVIDRVRADETHLIVDACYSYFLAYGRGPGGARREVHGFAEVEGLAHRPDVGLLLSTTVARESHEWQGFQAGVFSHEVRSGVYGAADFDGDGQVSYREIAAFVNRANAAIANERFRPEVFARPPRGTGALLDLRGGSSRRLRVGAAAAVDHYVLEDTRGVRLADFHNATGHELSLLLAPGAAPLYLRRMSDGQELAIPGDQHVIDLAALTPKEPLIATRGAAHDAFSLIFSLPFDEGALAGYAPSIDNRDDGALVDTTTSLPRWRKRAAAAALGVTAASGVAAVLLTISAQSLAVQARAAPSGAETAALNNRLTTQRNWAGAAYGLAAASAVAGGALLLWPTAPVHPVATVDAVAVTLGLGAHF